LTESGSTTSIISPQPARCWAIINGEGAASRTLDRPSSWLSSTSQCRPNWLRSTGRNLVRISTVADSSERFCST